MSGYEAADLAIVRAELEKFLPDTSAIYRRSTSQTKGDYVKGSDTLVTSSASVRIQPITPLGTEKTRLKSFPAAIADRAEYIITISGETAVKDGDIVYPSSAGGLGFHLLAVRFDNASWKPVVRAVAVRVE